MNLDFSQRGTVRIDMIPYIKKIVDAFPEKITGVQATPAGDQLFQVRPASEAKFLPEDLARVPFTMLRHNFFFFHGYPGIYKQ